MRRRCFHDDESPPYWTHNGWIMSRSLSNILTQTCFIFVFPRMSRKSVDVIKHLLFWTGTSLGVFSSTFIFTRRRRLLTVLFFSARWHSLLLIDPGLNIDYSIENSYQFSSTINPALLIHLICTTLEMKQTSMCFWGSEYALDCSN